MDACVRKEQRGTLPLQRLDVGVDRCNRRLAAPQDEGRRVDVGVLGSELLDRDASLDESGMVALELGLACSRGSKQTSTARTWANLSVSKMETVMSTNFLYALATSPKSPTFRSPSCLGYIEGSDDAAALLLEHNAFLTKVGKLLDDASASRPEGGQ